MAAKKDELWFDFPMLEEDRRKEMLLKLPHTHKMALPVLMASFYDPSPAIRTLAATVAGRSTIKSAKLDAELCRALHDKHSSVRQMAALSINELATRRRFPVARLVSGLKYRDTWARVHLISALEQMGIRAAAAIPVLKKLSTDRSKIVSMHATKALEAIGEYPTSLKKL